MAKITIVGAGGFVFPAKLSQDILSFPELQDSTLYLYDINPKTLARTRRIVTDLVKVHRLPAKVESGTNRRRALAGADYVIIAFQVGGIPAYTPDVEIPRKYGLDQPVGDTTGPGGVFRGLRTIAALKPIARDMKELAPNALLIQYANPMSINCWAAELMGIKTVGLCHSVQGTTHMLAHHLGIPYNEITFKCAGVNHQAWITDFRHNGKDVYPRLREVMDRKCPSPLGMKKAKGGKVGQLARMKPDHKVTDQVYYFESVRAELMRSFGYFHTESSHHGSEYVPWFRKNPKVVKTYLPWRWDYFEICKRYPKWAKQHDKKRIADEPLKLSEEYGARIIHSCETGNRSVIYGNVPNWGGPGVDPASPQGHLVTNLPRECSVEVACLVDGNGVQPISYGALPPQCAAINRSLVSVQELAVKAGLTGDRQMVYQAIALDPLTGALLTLPQIRSMVAEMFKAEKKWLPQFT